MVVASALAGCGRHPENAPVSQAAHSIGNNNEPGFIRGTGQNVDHLHLSQRQVETLKQAIAKLKFPQPEGTVGSLLPVQDYHWSSETTFDLHPVGNSPFVVNVYDYNLSAGDVLRIRQARYSGRKFCKTKEGIEVLRDSYTLDEAAEILSRDQANKTTESPSDSGDDKGTHSPDSSQQTVRVINLKH